MASRACEERGSQLVMSYRTWPLADFPQLTGDDIRACLAYAAERERRVVSVPAG